jgi:hypothetical protein
MRILVLSLSSLSRGINQVHFSWTILFLLILSSNKHVNGILDQMDACMCQTPTGAQAVERL